MMEMTVSRKEAAARKAAEGALYPVVAPSKIRPVRLFSPAFDLFFVVRYGLEHPAAPAAEHQQCTTSQ
jgi:hypothetical protein